MSLKHKLFPLILEEEEVVVVNKMKLEEEIESQQTSISFYCADHLRVYTHIFGGGGGTVG